MTTEQVLLARDGDRGAFGELAAGALDRLYATATLVLHDPILAEDAVQDALVRAWRSLPNLRDPARFDAWLRRVRDGRPIWSMDLADWDEVGVGVPRSNQVERQVTFSQPIALRENQVVGLTLAGCPDCRTLSILIMGWTP